MATLTIRGLPDEIHARLKERARKNRRSLNQEVIAVMIALGEEPDVPDEARRRSREKEMLARVAQLRAGITNFLTAEEIDSAVEEGRA